MSEPLLPHFAARVAEWFPELGGRSIAVSEMEVDKQRLPKIPLATTALVRSDMDGRWNWKSPYANQEMYDDFVTEFWLEPMKVRRADGSETPFWAFYDYETFRNALLSKVATYVGPSGQRIEYRALSVESDEYAVILSFQFRAHFYWCADKDESELADGQPINKNTITTNMCQPKSTVCDPCFDEPKECDPCPSE